MAATATASKIITSDHESAVQQEPQQPQPPMTRTSPSRRRTLSLISQALITPNHDLKILRDAIHETEIFLEHAKQELSDEVRALNGSIPKILAFLDLKRNEKERLRLLRGMVEGLEIGIRKGKREVRRLERRRRKRKSGEGDVGGEPAVADGEEVEAEVSRDVEEAVKALGEENAAKTTAKDGKDEPADNHLSQRSRKSSARALEDKSEIPQSKGLVKGEGESANIQASQRSRKSSAEVADKEEDARSDMYGLSNDPFPGELIVPEELVAAESSSSASSHTRITRAPTVASSRGTSIVKSKRTPAGSRKVSMVAPDEPKLDSEPAETSKEPGGRESDASKASSRHAAATTPSSKKSSKRSSRASDSRLEKVDGVEFAQPDFEKSKNAARFGDHGEVSPRAQSAVSAKSMKEVLVPGEEAAAPRKLQTSRASLRRTTAPSAASKHRASGGSAPPQHNLGAEDAKSNGLKVEEDNKADATPFSHRRSRSSKASSFKRPEEASIAAVRAASKASDHAQEGRGAEVASISSHHSGTSKSSSLRAEVTSEAAEERNADRESIAPRRSQSSRASGSKQPKDDFEAAVQIPMGDSARLPKAQEDEAASIRSHHSRTSKSSSLRAEVSSEAAEADMHPSEPPSRHSSHSSGSKTLQSEGKAKEGSDKSQHSGRSECSFAKAWATAAAAQHPLAASNPVEDMETGKRSSSAASGDRESSTRVSDRTGSSSRSLVGSGQRQDDESPQTSLTSHVSKSRKQRSSRSQHGSASKPGAVTSRSRNASTHSSVARHSDEVDVPEDDALQGYKKPDLPRKCHHSKSQASSRCPSVAWSCELVPGPQGQLKVDADHVHKRAGGCS